MNTGVTGAREERRASTRAREADREKEAKDRAIKEQRIYQQSPCVDACVSVCVCKGVRDERTSLPFSNEYNNEKHVLYP